jgi:ADP-ribose pyrophosphatase YjhB (NUDIX family)
VLLVRNERRNGTFDWSPPGGVIESESGEHELGGLAREVQEETGLVVHGWGPMLYQVVAVAPSLGWTMNASIYKAVDVRGDLVIGADPDGIVTAAEYVPSDLCHKTLEESHMWVREPLTEWLAQRWSQPRVFRYELVTLADGSRAVERK